LDFKEEKMKKLILVLLVMLVAGLVWAGENWDWIVETQECSSLPSEMGMTFDYERMLANEKEKSNLESVTLAEAIVAVVNAIPTSPCMPVGIGGNVGKIAGVEEERQEMQIDLLKRGPHPIPISRLENYRSSE